MATKHFRVKKYKDPNRPKLKFVVRSKGTAHLRFPGVRNLPFPGMPGKVQIPGWTRKFFETEAEAKTYAALKEIELLNQGTEGMNFPTELRVMAQRASQQLEPYGKNIDDAAQFYLRHLDTEKRSVPTQQAVEELIQNRRKAAGLSKLYMGDLNFVSGVSRKSSPSRTLSSITTAELNRFLESLEVGPVTATHSGAMFVPCSRSAVIIGIAPRIRRSPRPGPRNRAPKLQC